MRCLSCRVIMILSDDHHLCPNCGGEFFPAEYFRRREDPGYMQLWESCMVRYVKAMRDGQETARIFARTKRLAGV